ncbi:MAG: hypothetical protein GQ578_03200 [Desulfuromonadaceae bacterium]|nr:hypothetical protein [Desulfuromonadaceae bacterium]
MKLVGDLAGAYSRRISIQHRPVYRVLEDIRTAKVLRVWTHYEIRGYCSKYRELQDWAILIA